MKEKNKKRNKSNRLFLLLLLILATGTMLTASTYAWFTSNKTVTVQTFEVSVASSNGVQISADGTKWTALLKNDDLLATNDAENGKYLTSVNQIPNGQIAPVSTAGVIDATGKMEMYYGEIAADENTGIYKLTASKDTESHGSSGNFIAFDMFLKVNNKTAINLTNASGVVTGLEADQAIKNASRMAFINLGNIADGSALSDIQALHGTGETTPVKLWELNQNTHTATGVANAVDNYASIPGATSISADTDAAGKVNTSARLPYYGIKAPIPTGVVLDSTDSNYFKSMTMDYMTDADFSDNAANSLQFFDLEPGITKIRVYMWVEGQDVDCENNASGGVVKYNLQMTIDEARTAAFGA